MMEQRSPGDDPSAQRVEHRDVAETYDDVVVDDPATRNAGVYRLQEALYLLFGIIEVLIGIRFVLRAFGANSNAPFSAAIYAITGPLVAPFNGMFGTPRLDQSVFEPQSIVALIIYALVGWLLAKVVWLLMGDTRMSTATSTRTVRTERQRDRDIAA